ncbi:MAG: serine hydrolase domain-containing protein [Chthoniobacterales bacterium]
MKKLRSPLILFLCFPLFAFADLAEKVETLRKENGLTAAIVGVWKGEEVLLLKAFGESVTGVPANTEMKFRAGGACLTSLTCVLLQAVEEGKVSLDDTIEKWMPQLPEANKVTLRMLANCTSGYGDYVPSREFEKAFHENPFRDFTPGELIAYGVGDAVKYKPGTDWNYSHTNFVILGNILSKVYNQPVADLLTEKIIKPLGLKNTLYTPNAALPEPVLHAFTTERKIFEDSTFWNPSWTSWSGSIASTVDDLAILFRGIGQAKIIQPSSLKEMLAPTIVGLGPNEAERYYGLGIGMVDGWMFQNPSFGGYAGVIAYHPPTDRLIIIFVTLGKTTDPDTQYAMTLYQALRPEVFPPDS